MQQFYTSDQRDSGEHISLVRIQQVATVSNCNTSISYEWSHTKTQGKL